MGHICFASRAGVQALVLGVLAAGAFGQIPNHPVITEVFTDPAGNDGPVARDPSNAHQEYVEIYLPTAAQLAAGLNKDALRLTLYEVEGDTTSSGPGLVNYRIDLPTFDLDPANGLSPGAIPRPPSGVVVMGWVDYVGNPPTDLAGTPATRLALINGGITATSDYSFVAINGSQFSGTTNFPVPLAISSIDMPQEASSGIIQNGSGAYLLVNRDAPGYVQLYDDAAVPPGGSANPSLATGTVLGTSCLLDGYAGNDDSLFDVNLQPYASGTNIDMVMNLPAGGPFSLLICQIAEASAHGYARNFLDLAKTTEDGFPSNDNPVTDALDVYRTILNIGPLSPTPGRVHLTTSPAELSVALPAAQLFDVLAGTTGRPGIHCANAGGNFGMSATATPGASSNPAVATFASGDSAVVTTGQTPVYPSVAATVPIGAAHGALVTVPVSVSAVNVGGGPAIVNPTGTTTATIHVLNPTTGMNAAGQPFQATAFAAVHGLPHQSGMPNGFLSTSLAGFVAAHLGGLVDDAQHHGVDLLNPATDLSNPLVVDTLEQDMPDDPDLYINAFGPPGYPDLVQTIITSAEVQAGSDTYAQSFDDSLTAVRAIAFNFNPTRTKGGTFVPTERVHFVGAIGDAGSPTSGLTNATTTRGAELALVDTNVQRAGTLETGATDDFGVVVRVGQVRPGAQVVPGQFVFLSLTGGLQGADIDTLDVPPHNNETAIIYFDLDNLDTVLGARTISEIFVIDSSGTPADVNIVEVFSLNVLVPQPFFDADGDSDVDLVDYASFRACMTGPLGTLGAGCALNDADASGHVDLADYAIFQRSFTGAL
jgi:hypothetical protein